MAFGSGSGVYLPSRTQYRIVSLVVLLFLVTFSQGQGPGGTGQMVHLYVEEGLPPETVVGSIPVQSSFTYRLNPNSQHFKLDGDTGLITTKYILDREVLFNDINLFVISSEPAYPIEVKITVLDVNDNAPHFPLSHLTIVFPESENLNMYKYIGAATDEDQGANGTTTNYQIHSRTDTPVLKFDLEYDPETYGNHVKIRNIGILNREEQDFYQLNISVQDMGKPPRFGYLTLDINIDDANDNPPVFHVSEYVASLNETTPRSTTVIHVEASDLDIGLNGDITYTISDDTDQFTIDENTGIIYTSSEPPLHCLRICGGTFDLNTCQPRSCFLTVEAHDHGTPSHTGRAYVTVNIVDENDHDPQITFRYEPAGNTKYSSVNEDAKNGTLVALVTVQDQDDGVNGETSLHLTSGNEKVHFRLMSRFGMNLIFVNIQNEIDRERIPEYNLTLVAVDGGTPSRSSTAFLIIKVNDVNDHSPWFENAEYSSDLSELAPVGTFVANIHAIDLDTGLNAKLTYKILSGDVHNFFKINPGTGLVTVQNHLDYEQLNGSTVVMNISVQDGGDQPFTNYTSLSVTLLDENDFTPTFQEAELNISLVEGTQLGTTICMLMAEDLDSGQNGTVEYNLSSDVSLHYPLKFHLDGSTGKLTLIGQLDREDIAFYTVHVLAIDQGESPLSSTATVYISVLDLNDNHPIFYPVRYFVNVEENQIESREVVKIAASDPDFGLNGTVRFQIVGNVINFDIDPDSGVITTTNIFNHWQQNRFNLSVTAVDGMQLKAHENAVVTISVILTNTQLPVFLNVPYSFIINEDPDNVMLQTETEVGSVLATSDVGQIFYSIVAGDRFGLFVINFHTGLITKANKVDRELLPNHVLKVVADDGQKAAEADVKITVIDANDNTPKFKHRSVDCDVMENKPVGHAVCLAEATDLDSGPNAQIIYSLHSDSLYTFVIDETTGMIHLNKPLSRQILSYSMVVTARDSGTPQLQSTMNVTIHIKDINDHTPIFSLRSYEVSVIESSPVNHRIYSLSASDGDVGMNGYILYNITRGNEDGSFGVFPDGILYVGQQLDREHKDIYHLTVTACDQGYPPRSSAVNVTIYILDDNDNKPLFGNKTYVMSISENNSVKSLVGYVSASDLDIGRNAELTYWIGDEKSFIIDSQTGEIRTKKIFDREKIVQSNQQDIIEFEVLVHDNGLEKRLEDTATVQVRVMDVNDNAPQFKETQYKASVFEDKPVFSSVVKVEASDLDDGENGMITYLIITGNEAGIFEINPGTGLISLNAVIDRETEDHYHLVVTATDSGQIVKFTATAKVEIEILDMNDNFPLFDQSAVEARVLETTTPGKMISSFSATDTDLGNNAAISFAISGYDNDGTFSMDAATGKLYLVLELDYEVKNIYRLNITASDGGRPKLSSFVPFTVHIDDANDNSPVFDLIGIARITEGIALYNDTNLAMHASDADSGIFGTVTYAITMQNPPGNHFGIDRNTGKIYATAEIDREFSSFYNLTVVASDTDPVNSRSTTAMITVVVEDINDNSPHFLSMDAFTMPYPTIQGATITKIEATDPDSGDNGSVTYSILGSHSELFHINVNGLLYIGQLPSLMMYTVTVRATDNGNPHKFTDLVCTLIPVTGEDDGLSFTQSSYTGQIIENAVVDTSILTVATAPPVTGVEFYITSILRGTQPVERYFKVNKTTGVLSNSIVLDREQVGNEFTIQIHAVDTRGSQLSSNSVQAYVTLTDKNDTPPKFSQNFYFEEVQESVLVGTSVARVHVEDPDLSGHIQLTIKSGNEETFTIEEDGTIKTNRKLDRETIDEYNFEVQAKDNVHTSYTTVSLKVLDVNDCTPEFTNIAYSFDIPEDTPTSTIVGRVFAVDNDLGASGKVTYSFHSDWGQDMFHLNPVHGTITLLKPVDFEINQLYTLKVKATDEGSPSISSPLVTVYMNIKDVNDNTPLFDPMSYSQSIFEDIGVGTSVLQVAATDIDSGNNKEVRYSIIGGNFKKDFTIDPINGKIFTTAPLDREDLSIYTLIVEATDQAEAPYDRLSSAVEVSIILKDKNDCIPKFVTPSIIWVEENVPANRVLYSIRAEDRDVGQNSFINYRISQQSASLFTIDSVVGDLRASVVLDHEIQKTYYIVVTATDKGDTPLSASQNITVHVIDENDNDPKFTESGYNLTVDEDVKIGKSLLQVLATDEDSGLNGMVRYFIISGDSNQDFSLDQSSGVLSVQKLLDFERKRLYDLRIRAVDSGNDIRSTTANITVFVQDVNDNKPVFVDSPFFAYIQENQEESPVYVTKVSAVDSDSGVNSDLIYSIRDDQSIFEINSTTGKIVSKQILDRESKSMYTLVVIAIDSGTTRNTGTGTVTIFVEDVNDNLPIFQHSGLYVAHILENMPKETEVISVQATDKDEGVNCEIIYSLEDSMDGMFTILPKSGQIITMGTLDREQQAIYILTVIATDQGIPTWHDTATVTVIVDDKNDNMPHFEHQEYSAVLLNPTQSGEFVLGVLAEDSDIGNNGMIVYSISGQHSNLFHIDASSGVLTANRPLLTSGAIYKFDLHATDQGPEPLMSSITVTIEMSSDTNSLSNRPVFNPVPSNLHVSENMLENHVVTSVYAHSPTGGVIGYSLIGGNIGKAFSINPTTGTIIVSHSVDYEMTRKFRLWVAAQDVNASAQRSYVEVVINIDDENDNKPRFDQMKYQAEIWERSPLHTTVVRVHATDNDSGNNGVVHYKFSDSFANENMFSIDEETGLIKTEASLDREVIDHYELVVEAYDMGSPSQITMATVAVEILDDNDTPPKFTRTFSVSIMENTEVGTIILTVTSTDDDIGQNAAVSYNLSNNGDGKFGINNQTGNVTILESLDTESQERYSLEVTASDGAHHIQTRISVHVADVNDHNPEFITPLLFDLVENKPAQSFVGQVSAVDGDFSAPNNQIQYSLKLPSAMFGLDGLSGQLTSLKEIEYVNGSSNAEISNRYEFIVIATDLGTPRRSSEAKVIVNIIDANNNAPIFEKSSYHSAVPENSRIGESIIMVTARDELDHGINREIFYTVTEGNGSALFDVDTNTGVVKVSGSLNGNQNKKYRIVVRGQDKGHPPQFVSVDVYLTVTDVNRFAPVFVSGTVVQIEIAEDTKIGQVIQAFSATDSDTGLNGVVSYFITAGNSVDLFMLDEVHGDLSVSKPLDFDTTPNHELQITARDNGLLYKESTITFNVKLSDVNDNDPIFNQSLYEAYVAENSKIGTPIFKAFATDADSGNNKNIEYIVNSPLFMVEQTTGIVKTRSFLDYEEQDTYSITILAVNPGTNRKNSTLLVVHVTSENDYVPHFINNVYNFTISESATIGTSVGIVFATDQDKGEDGVVYYFLIGSSNAKGFQIDALTGEIRVSGQPDYESSPQIILEVLAKNYGSVKGNDTDQCIVGISVQDANDAPVFLKQVYMATLPENAQSGTEVIKVTAKDYDIRPGDKEFTYFIVGGNNDDIFGISRTTGLISVNHGGQLDREMVPHYHLIIGAEDIGNPPRTGTTEVNITLEDVNDNGPYFSPTNLTVSVHENQPIGTTVTDLIQYTDDLDLPPNKGVFHYVIIGTNHKFEVLDTGVVRTVYSINREQNPQLLVPVLVKDGGSPTMSSTLTFTVNIDDINDNPPMERDMKIFLAVYGETIPSGPFADVRPLDDDIEGQYSCNIENGSDQFWIGSDCKLGMSSLTNVDDYSFEVSGSDGKFSPVTYSVIVELVHFDNTTVDHSLVLQIKAITGQNFIENHYYSLKATIQDQLTGADDVIIFGIKNHQEDLLVFLAVKNERNGYFVRDVLKQQLDSIKATVESTVKIEIQDVTFSGCKDISCLNSGKCLNYIKVGGNVLYFDSPHLVFSSHLIDFSSYCKCPSQYEGDHCQNAIELCGNFYCQNGGSCVLDAKKERICNCTEGWEGQDCTMNINECSINPCKHSGYCEDMQGSFTCNCLPGFSGKFCELGFEHCSSDPCRNGATCENLVESFLCHCPYIFWGQLCQYSSHGFEKGSYMEFNSMAEYNNIINVTLTTTRENALLLYNPSEFIALEIIDRKVRFSWNLSSTEAFRMTTSMIIATGKWFQIYAVRNRKFASLTVTYCPDGDACEDCEDDTCHVEQLVETGSEKLEVKNHRLSIGGIKDIMTIVDNPGHVMTHDFIGCVRYFLINGLDMLQQTPLDSSAVTGSCPRTDSSSLCASAPCHNDGICKDEWSSVSCNCQPSHSGLTCQTEWQPFEFVPGSLVKYYVDESYRRDELLKQSSSRSPRSVGSSSIAIRFRSTKDNNLLFLAKTSSAQSIIWTDQGMLKYSIKKGDNPVTVAVDTRPVNDGNWHSVTVGVAGITVTMIVDFNETVSSDIFFDSFPFSSLDVQEISLGGSSTALSLNGFDLKDFNGCISRFDLDGRPVPFNSSDPRFIIELEGSVQAGCYQMCDGNPCGAKTSCVPVGEEISCIAEVDSEPLTVGVIVVITFFGVLLIVLIIVFVIFRVRRKLCFKKRTADNYKAHGMKSVNSSNHSHPDSGYGDTGERTGEIFIQNHVAQQMSGFKYHGHNGNFVRPDIIGSDPNRRSPMPLEIDDGTVIIENGDMMLHSVNDIPERYDIDTASSIAPSDIDVHEHYRHFRDVKGQKYKINPLMSHYKQQQYTPQNPGIRESPVSTSSHGRHSAVSTESPGTARKQNTSHSSPNSNSPFMDRHSSSSRNYRQTSPKILGARKNLKNQLSCQSPHTHAFVPMNLPGSNMTRSGGSRTNSDHSLTSYHSHSSAMQESHSTIPSGGICYRSNTGAHSENKIMNPCKNYHSGLTVEQVERLNSHPQHASQGSFLDVISSPSNEQQIQLRNGSSHLDTSILLEAPDSTSDDSANDSFTCSEFEQDNHLYDKAWGDLDPGAMLFSKFAKVDNHANYNQLNNPRIYDGLNSKGNSFNSNSEEELSHPHKLSNGQFNWDYLLNWGPSFERLVGVFKDIASLPDGENSGTIIDDALTIQEEYV
ncbi:hypothetical protein ScPMuIL_010366 [Solemya velum]